MSALSPRKTRRTRQTPSDQPAPPTRQSRRLTGSRTSDADSQASSAPSHADIDDESFPNLGHDLSSIRDGDDDEGRAPLVPQQQPRSRAPDFFSTGGGALSYAVGPASSRPPPGMGTGPVAGAYKPVTARGTTTSTSTSTGFAGMALSGRRGTSTTHTANGPNANGGPSNGGPSTLPQDRASTPSRALDVDVDVDVDVNGGTRSRASARKPRKSALNRDPTYSPSKDPDAVDDEYSGEMVDVDVDAEDEGEDGRSDGGNRGGVDRRTIMSRVMSPFRFVKREVMEAVRRAEEEARERKRATAGAGKTPGRKGRRNGEGGGGGGVEGLGVGGDGEGGGHGGARRALLLRTLPFLLLTALVVAAYVFYPSFTSTPPSSHTPISPSPPPPRTSPPSSIPPPVPTPENTPPPPSLLSSFLLGVRDGLTSLFFPTPTPSLSHRLDAIERRVGEHTALVARARSDAAAAEERAKRAEEVAKSAQEGREDRERDQKEVEEAVWKAVGSMAPERAIARKGEDGQWRLDEGFYAYMRARLADTRSGNTVGFVTADSSGWRALLARAESDVESFVAAKASEVVEGKVVEREEVVSIVRRELEREVTRVAVEKVVGKAGGGGGAGASTAAGGGGGGSDETILALLDRHLTSTYNLRRVDMADYAASATGGKVVTDLTTETFATPPQGVMSGIIGWVVGRGVPRGRPPVEALQGSGSVAGECWAMKGTTGNLTIHLSMPIHPTAFTLEHLPPSLAPNPTEGWKSAPRNLTFHAVLDTREFRTSSGSRGAVEVARVSYDPWRDQGWVRVHVGDEGKARLARAYAERNVGKDGSKGKQSATGGGDRGKPQVPVRPFVQQVQVRVESNWGNKNYTCVYRVRVHGDVKGAAAKALAAEGVGLAA